MMSDVSSKLPPLQAEVSIPTARPEIFGDPFQTAIQFPSFVVQESGAVWPRQLAYPGLCAPGVPRKLAPCARRHLLVEWQ